MDSRGEKAQMMSAKEGMRSEMEDIRDRLHGLIEDDESRLCSDEAHRLSRQLDRLIVEYMRYSS